MVIFFWFNHLSFFQHIFPISIQLFSKNIELIKINNLITTYSNLYLNNKDALRGHTIAISPHGPSDNLLEITAFIDVFVLWNIVPYIERSKVDNMSTSTCQSTCSTCRIIIELIVSEVRFYCCISIDLLTSALLWFKNFVL